MKKCIDYEEFMQAIEEALEFGIRYHARHLEHTGTMTASLVAAAYLYSMEFEHGFSVYGSMNIPARNKDWEAFRPFRNFAYLLMKALVKSDPCTCEFTSPLA